MRKKISIILILSLMFITLLNIGYSSYASTAQLITGMAQFSQTEKYSRIMYLLSKVFSLVQFVGTGLSLIVVVKLGITYFLASVEDKADIKKKALPLLIGSFLIVATVNILKFVQVIVDEAIGKAGGGSTGP